MLRFDVLAFHEQKASHIRFVVRKAGARAFNHGDHDRECFEADQEREVKLADVVDVLVLSDGPACDNKNRGSFHGRSFWSAWTSLESLSRPCEATRIWNWSMPILLEQSRT